MRIQGEDAETFLHGQFSSDVLALRPGGHQLGAYCNPKGRAIAIYRLLRDDSGFNLVLPEELAQTVVKRLTLFRMRARVDIHVDENNLLVGTLGPVDMERGNGWEIDGSRTLSLVARERFETFTSDRQRLPESAWKLGEILALEPQVYAATSEEFIPQQVNLDLVGGVSFSKGCYPGQEIIARVRYLGKIKQRMLSARIESDGPGPKPGDPLFSPERPDQKSGMVVDSVVSGGASLVTAMVPSTLIAGGELHYGAAGGPELDFLTPPYDVTTERQK